MGWCCSPLLTLTGPVCTVCMLLMLIQHARPEQGRQPSQGSGYSQNNSSESCLLRQDETFRLPLLFLRPQQSASLFRWNITNLLLFSAFFAFQKGRKTSCCTQFFLRVIKQNLVMTGICWNRSCRRTRRSANGMFNFIAKQ